MTMTNRAIREIEVQTKILKLQKLLEEAQVELGHLRKEDYAGSVAPVNATPAAPKTVPQQVRKVSTPQEVAPRKVSNAPSVQFKTATPGGSGISTENGGMWPALRKTTGAGASPTSSSDSITPPPADSIPPPAEDTPAPAPVPVPEAVTVADGADDTPAPPPPADAVASPGN